jgi:hypothetical protein
MDNCYQTQTSVMFVHAIMLGYLSVCDSLFAILWGDSLGRFSVCDSLGRFSGAILWGDRNSADSHVLNLAMRSRASKI